MSASLKYTGKVPSVEVTGYGHFAPGEEKIVDESTAREFEQPACQAEGWVVTRTTDSKKKTADTASTDSAYDPSPRGQRTSRTNND
jgi:hypothetical protein